MDLDHQWWAIIVGYLYSIIPGFFLIEEFGARANVQLGVYERNYLDKNIFYRLFSPREMDQYLRWTPILLGILERIIYTTSILTRNPQFIAVWLALKAISTWRNWQIDNGRGMFNVFLIGTGFSLLYGTLGGQIVVWLDDCKWLYVAISSVALVAVNCLFICIANRQVRFDAHLWKMGIRTIKEIEKYMSNEK